MLSIQDIVSNAENLGLVTERVGPKKEKNADCLIAVLLRGTCLKRFLGMKSCEQVDPLNTNQLLSSRARNVPY